MVEQKQDIYFKSRVHPDRTVSLEMQQGIRKETYECPDFETSKAVARRLAGMEFLVPKRKTKKYKEAVDKTIASFLLRKS